MKNMYIDRLDSFSFAEIFDALDSVGAETQRLEFKREIPARKLAQKICSFANASGGIIVIGIDEPTPGERLHLSPQPVDIGDKKILSYSATINALVYPQPPFEIFGYLDASSGHTLLIVRIGSSSIGPHEYIGGDTNNLPIRRGTETRSLGLADIEALQRRRDGTPSESPLKHRPFQKVMLIQTGTGGDFYFGVSVTPVVYGPKRVMDPDDDIVCLAIEERTRGNKNIVHPSMMTTESTGEGFWMHTGDAPGFAVQPNVPSAQIEIDSDGLILMRFQQRDGNALDQYINVFLTAYAVAQEMFYHFRLSPYAQFYIVAHLNAEAPHSGAPQFHEDRIEVDLARQSFADAFTNTVMVMFRTAKQPKKRSEVHELLGDHESSKLPLLDGQFERWLSASEK
jgi:hypothetical protein